MRALAWLNIFLIFFALLVCKNWESPQPTDLVVELDVPNVKNIDNLFYLLHDTDDFCHRLEELSSISNCSLYPRLEKTFYEFEIDLRLGTNALSAKGNFNVTSNRAAKMIELNTYIRYGFLESPKFLTVVVFDTQRNKVLINFELPSVVLHFYQAIGEKRISNRLSNELSNALYHFKN